jgi:hypothetical protein
MQQNPSLRARPPNPAPVPLDAQETANRGPIVRLADLPDILTPAEVCGILRKEVDKPCKAIRALERGGLRVLKVGRDLRVMRVDLETFLAAVSK